MSTFVLDLVSRLFLRRAPRYGELIAAPEPRLGWLRDRRLVLGGLLLVLGLRSLYLALFGWDPNWMGFNYLSGAKALWLGQAVFEEPPLPALLLLAGRFAGLAASEAIGAVYLLAHVIFFLGIVGVASFVWPTASPRRQLFVVVLIATLPLFAGTWGHANLGPLLGASMAAAALALVLAAAGAEVPRSRHLAGAMVFAALAVGARYEAAATVLATSVVLFTLGRRMEGLRSPRLAAAGLVAGAAVGFSLVFLLRETLFVVGRAGVNYGFYTFYDGLPFLMWSDVAEHVDEYGRYLDSMTYFGSYAENGGSVVTALLSNPGAALARFAAKVPELFGGLVWPETFGPLGVTLAGLGLRGLTAGRVREGLGLARGLVLVGYLGPLCLLFVPPPSPPYFLCIACPLVLAAARGAERCLARVSTRALRFLVVVYFVVSVLLLVFFGRTEFASSPIAAPAAAYLETRCEKGCLVNFLPMAISKQSFVDLEAGAPFPRKQSRSEAFVVANDLAEYRRAFRFHERVRRARASGYAGPVLYVRYRFRSAALVHPVFDPEPGYEGRVDLSSATLEQVFARGEDEIEIYSFPSR